MNEQKLCQQQQWCLIPRSLQPSFRPLRFSIDVSIALIAKGIPNQHLNEVKAIGLY